MQFGNGSYFWLVLILPVLIVLARASIRARTRSLQKFADIELLPKLVGELPDIIRAHIWRAAWITVVSLFLIVSLLRPQWGFTWRESSRAGIDIVIALDVSDSMLAEDVRPSRLVRAKRELVDLLESLQGDRVALITFAGSAYLEVPLTLDYGAFRLFLNAVSPEYLPIKGTNIEIAAEESVKAFRRAEKASGGGTAKRGRALLIITDGESFDGDISHARSVAQDNGVQVYVMGIGTSEGAPIPTPKGYRKDKEGHLIISRLQEDVLQDLATHTGGMYVTSISSSQDTNALYQFGMRVKLAANALSGARAKRWNEYFQLPLLLAVLLLVCGPWSALWRLLGRRKRSSLSPGRVQLSSKATLIFLLVTAGSLAVPANSLAQSAEDLGARARREYELGDFASAVKEFAEGSAKSANDFRFTVGEGASRYRLGDFEQAKALFFKAAAQTSDKKAKAQILFDAGNSSVQLQQYKEAIKAYEDSLKLAPEDRETQENLALARKLLEQQKQQKQDNQQQQNKQSSDEKNSEKNKNEQTSQGENKNDNEQHSSESAKQNQEEKNQQQDKDEQRREGDESSKNEDQGKDTEKDQQQDAAGKKNNKDANKNEGRNSGAQSEQDSGENDQTEAQINTVEEKNSARMKYRMRTGMTQLEEHDLKLPEKDW